MTNALGTSVGRASDGPFEFVESVILTQAPERTGVYVLLRSDSNRDRKEPLSVRIGTIRNELLIAFRSRSVPRATHFMFQVCNLGTEADKITAEWERMLPKHGKKWKALSESIGSGGQSRIQLVEDITGAQPGKYALKLLKARNSAQARTRFKIEVTATQRIDHPSVLKIYDFDLDSKEPYYVAEYCEGNSLLARGAEEFRVT